MRIVKLVAGSVLVLVLCGLPVFAEESQEQGRADRPQPRVEKAEKAKPLYRIGMVVRELKGTARTGQKSYVLVLEENEGGRLRVLRTAKYALGTGFESIETGLKSDVSFEEKSGSVYLDMEIHMTELGDGTTQGATLPPVETFQCRVESVLQPGVPTVVARFDGNEDGRSYEIEVNAEKLR